MIRDYVNFTFKNVKKRGLRSWLTMLGIFIGIASIVALISLGNSLQKGITGQFSGFGTDKLTISNAETGYGPPGSTTIKKLTENDFNIINNINGIEFVIPRYVRSAEIKYGKVSNYQYVASLPIEEGKIKTVYNALNLKIDSGRLIKEGDTGKVLLGNNYFKEDIFGKKISTGKSIEIQGKKFKVSGILKEASTFIVNSIILVPEKDVKELFNIDNEIDLIVVQVKDEKNIKNIAEDIRNALRKDRNLDIGEEDFSVQTPEENLEAINTILSILNLIIIAIASISLFVGGIGIANTMYTSVVERTKDIGIMKSIGARNKDILLLFLFESSILGLVGGIGGVIIGLGLAFSISYMASIFLPGLEITTFGIDFSILLISFSIFFSFLIGAMSGIFPALQASKLTPVEALRK